jgi:glycine betaine/proline transport system ATP-binding protein
VPNPKTNPKIKIESLIKIYGDQPRKALKLFREGKTRDEILKLTGHVLGIADVSLTIAQGEIFVVMGLSGSGKSTLVRCINRLISPTSGHIYIDGEDVAHVDEKRMRDIRLTKISMVFQGFGLLPHKTVAQNVAYGLKVRGVSKNKRRQKAWETLERVGLAQWADYLPSSLSGGMQQRVGLARALATDADILLMDEPFSALDPLIRREMQDELLRLQTELHKTIVFISHDIQEALKIGDRIAVMKDGYIVQVGEPEEFVTQPQDDYIRAFLQDVNRAHVVKAGTIARQTMPLTLGEDSAKVALEQMLQQNLQEMYVVDSQGKLVGLVNRQILEKAIGQQKEDLTDIMETNMAKVKTSNTLEHLFHLCQENQAIAVVDDREKFAGIIQQSDLLASLSKLNDINDTLETKRGV